MGSWTIDELAQRAADALAASGVRAPNGRVTEVPDRRVIRWYATIGLLDRPLRGGRTARYGEHHLLQLVAVKRRQGEGRSLAEIQAELAGATDATLRRVAGLPDSLPAGAMDAEDAPRARFWAAPPDPAPRAAVPGRALAPPLPHPHPHPQARPPAPEPEPVPLPAPVYPVPLDPAATLTLHALPTPDDLAAIHTAARPLLDLLADRGLLTRPPQRRPR
jgi:hypothetical protein